MIQNRKIIKSSDILWNAQSNTEHKSQGKSSRRTLAALLQTQTVPSEGYYGNERERPMLTAATHLPPTT